MPSLQFTAHLLDLVFAKELKIPPEPKWITRRIACGDDLLILGHAIPLPDGLVTGKIYGVKRFGRLVFATEHADGLGVRDVLTSVRRGRYGKTVGTIRIKSILLEPLWRIEQYAGEIEAEGFSNLVAFATEWNRLHTDSAVWYKMNPLVYRLAFEVVDFYKEIYRQGRTRIDRPPAAADVTQSKRRPSAHAHQ